MCTCIEHTTCLHFLKVNTATPIYQASTSHFLTIKLHIDDILVVGDEHDHTLNCTLDHRTVSVTASA
jgi:hypothetical protein